MKKVVILDAGVLTHRSIFAWGAEKRRLLLKGTDDDPRCPASYTYLNTCYATLKKIGIDKDDIVIVAKDGWNSWRKAFLPEYKGQRKALRKSHEEIDWKAQYAIINRLERQLDKYTNWHVLQLNNAFNFADLCLTDEGQELNIEDYDIDMATEYGIECDDIMAVAVKYFKNYDEIVLMTIDEDISQLVYYKNVKIFNPNLKSPTNKANKG